MTESENSLLSTLRKIKVWEHKNASFTVHLDADGNVAKVDMNTHYKITRLSTGMNGNYLDS